MTTDNGVAALQRDDDYAKFKRSYLIAFLCGASADWLKGPYIYRFYEARGFTKEEITLLFVAGYTSSAVFGLVVGMMSDAFGRRKMCFLFCVLYSLHCALHVLQSFVALLVARAVSGVATALLFSTFEAWMVAEHTKRFAHGDLAAIFATQTQANAVCAVLSGVVAQAVVEVGGYGAPFAVAAILLAVCALNMRDWPENVGNKRRELGALVKTTVRTMDSLVVKIGLLQCLFEGSMHIFVFLWTPCLQRDGGTVPHGLVFALYMLCVLIGGRCTTANSWLWCGLGVVYTVGTCCLLVPYLFMNFWCSLLAFCGFEWCCGCYFPQIATLRSKHLHEESRGTMMTLFRIPFNGIVVATLLHGRSLAPERMLLVGASALALGALTCATLPASAPSSHSASMVGTGTAKESKED